MEALFNEMIPVIQQLWAEAKWLGALGAVLLFGIRIFRLDTIQQMIPAKARWSAWPQWLKWLAPFAVAFAGSLVWKLGAGLSWGVALAFAITSAAASIVAHKTTKRLGEYEEARRDPGHEPGQLRKATSIIIPIHKPPR